MARLAQTCARDVLDVVPGLMHSIRTEMRQRRRPDLSVPQFRTLGFICRDPGASLSAVAEHLGLTPPSTCRLVDGLEARGLVTRQAVPEDRRRVTLAPTAAGRATLAATRSAAQACLARRLANLPEGKLVEVVQALQTLRPLFGRG
jgi:DNA-binding MarR family transcriptional regulator